MWFTKMLNDQNGKNSSKRFMAFLAMIQVLIIANRQVWGENVSIDKDIWWGLISLVAAGLGLSYAEFLSKKKDTKS